MGFISKLFFRKATDQSESEVSDQEPVTDFIDALEQQKSAAESLDGAMMSAVSEKSVLPEIDSTPEEAGPAKSGSENDGSSSVNIWDMSEDESSDSSQASKTTDSEKPTRPRRRTRNKTRILGFEPQDTTINDLLQANSVDTEAARNTMVMDATGWLIVIEGPGRGASYPLFSGMANIGRGADQMIALDFGDTSISRNNHASIAYDSSDHVFYFGHGGKSNLVRMNGKPVLSTEVAKDGDEFMIGETTLRLMTICGPDFNWETTAEGDDDVEIA